jgi:hypothetical protein
MRKEKRDLRRAAAGVEQIELDLGLWSPGQRGDEGDTKAAACWEKERRHPAA